MATSAEAVKFIKPTAPPLDERSKYLRKLVVRALEGGERGHIGSSMSLSISTGWPSTPTSAMEWVRATGT